MLKTIVWRVLRKLIFRFCSRLEDIKQFIKTFLIYSWSKSHWVTAHDFVDYGWQLPYVMGYIDYGVLEWWHGLPVDGFGERDPWFRADHSCLPYKVGKLHPDIEWRHRWFAGPGRHHPFCTVKETHQLGETKLSPIVLRVTSNGSQRTSGSMRSLSNDRNDGTLILSSSLVLRLLDGTAVPGERKISIKGCLKQILFGYCRWVTGEELCVWVELGRSSGYHWAFLYS